MVQALRLHPLCHEAMPRRRVDVVLSRMSGQEEQVVYRATRSQTILSLKALLKSQLGIRKWRIAILQDTTICDDGLKLGELTEYEPLPAYVIIDDLVPASVFMPALPLHLGVVIKDAVVNCPSCLQEGSDLNRCSGCMKVWYCSEVCQRRHWTDHKKTCQGRR